MKPRSCACGTLVLWLPRMYRAVEMRPVHYVDGMEAIVIRRDPLRVLPAGDVHPPPRNCYPLHYCASDRARMDTRGLANVDHIGAVVGRDWRKIVP